MSDFDNMWANANPDNAGGEGNDLEPPADGMYDVALLDAGAFVSKAGAPFVKMRWQVVSHAQQGYEWTVLLGFKSQTQADVTKRAVRDLGIQVDSLIGLEAVETAIKEKLGGYYTVEVVRKESNGKVFPNTYLQDSRPAQPDIPVPVAAAAPVPTPVDDVPWD
jgi:hypothetical protein